MEKYNILYYSWREVTYEDAVESLKKLGHQVYVDNTRFQLYDNDEKFMEVITKKIRDNNIDLIFTFNYFPDLSRVADKLNKKYVCWVYDSPHRVLDSITNNNNCNYIFLFDYMLYEKYRADGVDTVYYMPLACNVDRVQNMLQEKFKKNGFAYQHDITFLGSMKNDEFDFYSQIKYMSPYVKGYVDAVMEAQIPIFGMDMVSYLMRDDICEEIFKTVKIEMGSNYKVNNKEILIDMIMKRITVSERARILTVLGEKYKVDHYCDKKAEGLPVNYKGYAAYATDMPEIFATSKINLNITLRSIQSGIPLRVIDILGAGGFCISNYQSELANYFENNKSIVWYESYEELFEKVDYYLNHDDERQAIACKGHDIVKNDFSYEKILTKIFEMI